MNPKLLTTISTLVLILATSFSAFADGSEEASKIISKTVEQLRSTIEKNQGKLSNEDLDSKLREIIAPAFDFREMSMRSLGANWRKATPAEQKEFVDLFSDLLAENYLKKIRENILDSELKMVGNTMRGNKAVVQTEVYTEDDSVSINYRMRQRNNTWRVYDVVIENIGLVGNYRSEFAGIIRNDKMSGLLRKLREKSQK